MGTVPMRFYTGKRELRLGGTPRPTISAMKVELAGDLSPKNPYSRFLLIVGN